MLLSRRNNYVKTELVMLTSRETLINNYRKSNDGKKIKVIVEECEYE